MCPNFTPYFQNHVVPSLQDAAVNHLGVWLFSITNVGVTFLECCCQLALVHLLCSLLKLLACCCLSYFS